MYSWKKNIFIIDKDDNDKIIINKIIDVKNNKDYKNFDSIDKYSKYSKINSLKQKNDILVKEDYLYNQKLERNKSLLKYNENEKNQDKDEINKKLSRSTQIILKNEKLIKSKINLRKSRRTSVEDLNISNLELDFTNENKNIKKINYNKISSFNISNESEIRMLREINNFKVQEK